MKPFIRLALLGALFGFHCAALAATGFQCSVPAGVSLNFGNYDDSSPATTDVSTTFPVNCCRTGGSSPQSGTMTITFGASMTSGQINTRQMKNSLNADRMSYQLYFTSFGGTVWGDGITGGFPFSQFVSIATACGAGGQAVPVTSAIFGRIFAQQPVSAGSYADTLTITITP